MKKPEAFISQKPFKIDGKQSNMKYGNTTALNSHFSLNNLAVKITQDIGKSNASYRNSLNRVHDCSRGGSLKNL